MTDLPDALLTLATMYDDHIGLSANEGYPLALDIRRAYRVWRDTPCEPNLAIFAALIERYHALYEAAPVCGCGQEHIMPGYRVCHPCHFTRVMYPHIFEADPEPDALPWDAEDTEPPAPTPEDVGQMRLGEDAP